MEKSTLISRSFTIIAVLALWEGLTAAGYVDTRFLPPPSQITLKVYAVSGHDPILRAFWVTALEVMIAFAVSLLAGVFIGVAVGLSRYLFQVFHPVLIMAFAMPQVIVFPLFLRFFGIGMNSKIAFGISHGFFPIVLNVIAGARSVDPNLVVISHSMGATRLQIMRKVVLPSMLPTMFTGFRLGMGLTLLGVLLAELFVSQKGVGYFINLYTESFKSADLFAIIAILSFIAIAVNEGLRVVERRLSRWTEV